MNKRTHKFHDLFFSYVIDTKIILCLSFALNSKIYCLKISNTNEKTQKCFNLINYVGCWEMN
jgi:hypothetical protein